MPIINIMVAGKIATNVTPDKRIICGNSDYTVVFDFDDEWSKENVHTARFVYRKSGKLQYTDIVFTGNTVAVPILTNTYAVQVGVYAGNLHTTTPAQIKCDSSILCDGGLPADPEPDVYAQIMELLSQSGGGTSFKTDETLTLKNGVLSVNTATEVEQDNTLPVTSAAVAATVGNIEVLLKTI